MRRGMNSSEMQKRNRTLVFKTLLEYGSMTRTELASRIGLQKATITNIINSFLEMGIIAVDGDTASGRRGENVCLKLDGLYVFSIGITRKDFQIDVFSLNGASIEHVLYTFLPNEDIHPIIEKLKEDLLNLREKYGERKLIGASLAVPGLYIRRNSEEGDMFQVSEFEQLSEINIRSELEETLGFPILIKHDAKLGAYAEWRNSPEALADENATLIMIRSRGFGIGAGIIVRGRILEGQLGIAGEIGHMGINYNGRKSEHEDRGSFEYSAGTESAVRFMLERLCEFPDTVLDENSSYQDIVEAYRKKDPLAVWTMEKMAWMLGYGIANIVYTINPDCIILGPDYPNLEEFVDKVREAIKQFVPSFVGENITIRYSALSEDSFLLGGYYYLIEQMCTENTILEKIRTALQ